MDKQSFRFEKRARRKKNEEEKGPEEKKKKKRKHQEEKNGGKGEKIPPKKKMTKKNPVVGPEVSTPSVWRQRGSASRQAPATFDGASHFSITP